MIGVQHIFLGEIKIKSKISWSCYSDEETTPALLWEKIQWKPQLSSFNFFPFASWLKTKNRQKKLLATESPLFFYDESLTKHIHEYSNGFKNYLNQDLLKIQFPTVFSLFSEEILKGSTTSSELTGK